MKRFTETTKWANPWYRKLPARLKLVWNFLCENCDAAGVIDPDWELMGFQIGEPCTPSDLAAFGNRIVEIKGGKLFIVKFIEFQYGKLSRACKPHLKVLQTIDLHRIHTLCKGYLKGIDTLEEEEKDKEKDKKKTTKRSAEGKITAEEFLGEWNAAEGLRPIRHLGQSRLQQLRARSKEAFFLQNYREALRRAAASDFCKGRNDRGWVADLEWFLRPDTVAKLLEGKYDAAPAAAGNRKGPVFRV